MSCDCDTLIVGQAGPQGPQGFNGLDGTNGSNGVNSFSTLSVSFVQPNVAPAAGNTVTVSVSASAWMAIGQSIFIEQAGFFTVTSINSSTSVTISLRSASGVLPGQTVTSGRKISPAGFGAEIGLTSSFSSISVNDSFASNPTTFRVFGSSGLPLFLTNSALNKAGVNITPSAASATFSVGGSFESTGDIVSSGAVQAPRLRLVSAGPELTKIVRAAVSETVSISGSIGAVTKATVTVLGVALGDMVQVAYTADPVTSFETDVIVNAAATSANTVTLFFTNTSTNAYASASVSLVIVATRYEPV